MINTTTSKTQEVTARTLSLSLVLSLSLSRHFRLFFYLHLKIHVNSLSFIGIIRQQFFFLILYNMVTM